MSQVRLLVTGGSGFIGTNLIREVDRRGGFEVLNLDLATPKIEVGLCVVPTLRSFESTRVRAEVCQFKPNCVVHLGGRTDMSGSSVDDYAANDIGTKHVTLAIRQTPSVERVVFTSSQYVVGPGKMPASDEDCRPHTIYGESKVLSEKVVREANLPVSWTIIRPTNIWGRWHPRYPNEFWRVLKQGRYVHPGGDPVVRCYGYVGTVVDQVLNILERGDRSLDGKTLYVGDPPIDIYEWTNAFSLELTGRPVRVVPRFGDLGLGESGGCRDSAGRKVSNLQLSLPEHDRRVCDADGTHL